MLNSILTKLLRQGKGKQFSMSVFYTDEDWKVRLKNLMDLLKSLIPEEKLQSVMKVFNETIEFAENKQQIKLFDELLEIHNNHISTLTVKKVKLLTFPG